MNKEKQIEEIKKVISDICPFYKEYNSCEQCNDIADIDDEPCYWECMAKGIVRYGYRKASEVIDEFAERLLKNILKYTIGNDQLAYFLKGYINKTANEMKGADNG